MLDFALFLSRTLSLKEIDFLVEEIHAAPPRIDELLALLDHENSQLAWHAAWALQKVFRKYPEFFSQRMLNCLTQKAISAEQEGMKRITLSIVVFADLPDELPVSLVNCCFEWMLSVKTSIAVKALSIHYLHRICKQEPDMLPELQLSVIQLLETTDTPAIRSVARKVLKD